MSLTVWGEAGGIGTLAAERGPLGAIEGAHSYNELSLQLPDGGITVDADHDPKQPLGELVFAELGSDERLRCVAVVDDWLAPVLEERELFFSPLLEMRGNGIDRSDTYIAREAELIGLSLTLATARLGAWPLRFRAGDLRSSVDRGSWPISWRSDPLLARAHEDMAGVPLVELRHRSASRIVDRRDNGDNPWRLREGQPAPADLVSTRLPGGLRRGAPGRIISVR